MEKYIFIVSIDNVKNGSEWLEWEAKHELIETKEEIGEWTDGTANQLRDWAVKEYTNQEVNREMSQRSKRWMRSHRWEEGRDGYNDFGAPVVSEQGLLIDFSIIICFRETIERYMNALSMSRQSLGISTKGHMWGRTTPHSIISYDSIPRLHTICHSKQFCLLFDIFYIQSLIRCDISAQLLSVYSNSEWILCKN